MDKEKILEGLEDQLFALKMADHWTDEDFQYFHSLSRKIFILKKEMGLIK